MKIRFVQKLIDKLRGESFTEYSHIGDKHIYRGVCANELIRKELESDKPSMICRFGSVECMTAYDFLRYNKKYPVMKFSKSQKHGMAYNAGFFPVNDYMMQRFASEFLELIKNIDILGVWFCRGEEKILKKYATDSLQYVKLVDLDVVGSGYENPYTQYFAGKKILVISPFSESIKKQYANRNLLHKNTKILPEFELITIKAVQSLHDCVEDLPFTDWFEALEYMKRQIDAVDFDIAVIGCGAYGIFLADYCKKIGKKAIHLGGNHQILFGIKGNRWGNAEFMNKYWISPSDDERPKGFEKVEDACYW